MPGAVEFKREKPIEGGLGLLEAEMESIRVRFPNPKAALLVDVEKNRWLPWGRRKEEPGDWPEGGWAREESLNKPYWTKWDPEQLIIRMSQWMEKGHHDGRSYWFDVPEGHAVLALRLRSVPSEPVYIVTEASYGDYAEIHDRMPKLVKLR